MTGSGTLLDPYVIYDATDLQNVENNLASHYIFNNDINCSGIGNFVPVGQGAPYFTGTLDGREYTIFNFTINRPAENYVGLFGVTDDATIQNVTLNNPTVHGDDYTGSLIGLTIGNETILNCHSVGGTVTGNKYISGFIGYISGTSDIDDCDTSCAVTSDFVGATLHNAVGGFAGYMTGTPTIDNCFATGEVTGIDREVGGFVGAFIGGTCNKCYAAGDVITGEDGGISYCGGFVGWATGGIAIDCYARGSVTGTGDGVGGFAGVSGTETNCYSTGAVSGVGVDVGGFCGAAGTVVNSFWDTQTSGQAASDGGTGKTTAQMKIKSTFTRAGWDFISIWGITRYVNSGYPHFGPSLSDQDFVDQTVIGNKVSLEAIRNLEIVYGGRAYISKTGNFVYESRYHRNV